jgi:hypothetical protein
VYQVLVPVSTGYGYGASSSYPVPLGTSRTTLVYLLDRHVQLGRLEFRTMIIVVLVEW